MIIYGLHVDFYQSSKRCSAEDFVKLSTDIQVFYSVYWKIRPFLKALLLVDHADLH